MYGLGMRELVIVVAVAAIIWPYCRVVSRAGYSPWLGLLIIVPLVNVIALWVFAYVRWPALPEAKPPVP
jgi:hypothetical protein